MKKNEALKFMIARMQRCDFPLTDGKTDLKNCSFRLSTEQLAEVDWIAAQSSLSRSRTMVMLMKLGIDELLSCLPQEAGDTSSEDK